MPTAPSHRATPKREAKTERIEVRVAPLAKRTIQRASAVSGLAVGDLAYEGARRILQEHEQMELRGADRDAFLAALEKPARPTRRLVSAMRRHAKLSSR